MIDLETFGGPGGWSTGAAALGLRTVGIEIDAAACATRRAAGHRVACRTGFRFAERYAQRCRLLTAPEAPAGKEEAA